MRIATVICSLILFIPGVGLPALVQSRLAQPGGEENFRKQVEIFDHATRYFKGRNELPLTRESPLNAFRYRLAKALKSYYEIKDEPLFRHPSLMRMLEAYKKLEVYFDEPPIAELLFDLFVVRFQLRYSVVVDPDSLIDLRDLAFLMERSENPKEVLDLVMAGFDSGENEAFLKLTVALIKKMDPFKSEFSDEILFGLLLRYDDQFEDVLVHSSLIDESAIYKFPKTSEYIAKAFLATGQPGHGVKRGTATNLFEKIFTIRSLKRDFGSWIRLMNKVPRLQEHAQVLLEKQRRFQESDFQLLAEIKNCGNELKSRQARK